MLAKLYRNGWEQINQLGPQFVGYYNKPSELM
jgi:hypothetical protein